MSTNPPPPKGGLLLTEAKFNRLLELASEIASTQDINVATRNGKQIEQLLRTVARGEYE